MGVFTSAAGTELHYELRGEGPPLICHPGGPGRPASYLDDLGGVAHTLVLLDPRGTGESEPATPCAFSDLADDLELLRVHLGAERLDVLGHSAGAWPVLAYAARHPSRVSRLVLLTPSRKPIPQGADEPTQDVLVKRWFSAEPWYPAAKAAWDADDLPGLMPLIYATDTPEVRAHASRPEATADYEAEFWSAALDPGDLAAVGVPVSIIAADRDVVTGLAAPHVLADWLPNASIIWLPDAGHFPWVTHPELTRLSIDEALAS
ncbi:pimeloyl-ACP methyl ester carboxylesterase [Actinoplanes tereljensis]|uniref:Hydrolase n=1 Tax=Paractinoplanes tereljensis TaxID=571912 RepID=A0A919NFL2_9ACTN|nr:alpha/beta hydrolase [Actinoplanes tereljensis]GIF17680.1 hydrolase [Actinoplanes tereljensis]